MVRHKSPCTLVQLSLNSFGVLVRQIVQFYLESNLPVPDELQQFLQPRLPQCLIDMITPHVLRVFGEEVRSYFVCEHINQEEIRTLRSLVVTLISPDVTKLVQTEDAFSLLYLSLCTQLHRFTKLRVLDIPTLPLGLQIMKSAGLDYGVQLALLPSLTALTMHDCTDEVLEVVAEHCRHLELLDISLSKKVTSKSVCSIVKLQKLKTLNVSGIHFTNEDYARLVEGLHNLEVASFFSKVVPLWMSLPELVSRCARLTSLTILNVDQLSKKELSKFTNLRDLDIALCDFSKAKEILWLFKDQVTTLHLNKVKNVDFAVLSKFTKLRSLNFHFTTVSDNFDEVCFEDLEEIKLWDGLTHGSDLLMLLRACTNLKSVSLFEHSFELDNLINKAVRSGCLRHIENFEVGGVLAVETLRYLIECCPELKKILYISRSIEQRSDIENLKIFIKMNNIDIRLTCIF